MTVTELKGFGRQTEMVHRDLSWSRVHDRPHSEDQLDIAVGNEQTDGVIEAIKSATRTETIAYSRIFVSDMEQEIRIRTSEVGVDAI